MPQQIIYENDETIKYQRNKLREVVDKANQMGIEKTQIISIMQDKDGTFTMTYYGED